MGSSPETPQRQSARRGQASARRFCRSGSTSSIALSICAAFIPSRSAAQRSIAPAAGRPSASMRPAPARAASREAARQSANCARVSRPRRRVSCPSQQTRGSAAAPRPPARSALKRSSRSEPRQSQSSFSPFFGRRRSSSRPSCSSASRPSCQYARWSSQSRALASTGVKRSASGSVPSLLGRSVSSRLSPSSPAAHWRSRLTAALCISQSKRQRSSPKVQRKAGAFVRASPPSSRVGQSSGRYTQSSPSIASLTPRFVSRRL